MTPIRLPAPGLTGDQRPPGSLPADISNGQAGSHEAADPRPAYKRIADGLRRQIAEGVYRPGSRLPSMSKQAAQHGVSEIVIRWALAELKHEGLVGTRRGRSTIVLRQPCSPQSTSPPDAPLTRDLQGRAPVVSPDDLPVTLRLTLPAHLRDSEVIQSLAGAIQSVCDTMARRARIWREANQSATQDRDAVRQEVTLAVADAYAAMTESLAEHLCSDLELRDQNVAFETLTLGLVLASRGLTPTDNRQPPLPLPQAQEQAVGDLLGVVLQYRDALRVSAAKFLHVAAEDANQDLRRRLDFHSQAKAFAIAADQLDLTLTHFYGADDAYQTYTDEQGACLEHVVLPPDLGDLVIHPAPVRRGQP